MIMKIKIMHLFPDLLNLYGDKGNIECMRKRLEWRGIECEVTEFTSDNTSLDLSDVDIVFLGGGSDREQKIVCSALMEYKDTIKEYAENNGSIIALCGGFHLLGKSCKLGDEAFEALGVLDVSTEQGSDRLISDVVLESELIGERAIIGFENHSERVNINSHKPLGKVLYGNGNDGKSGVEGVVYKNVIASNLHGPLFPKNPALCDYVLTNALKKKYSDFTELSALDDTMENKANEYMKNRFIK